jgi:hypothetical protein
MAVVYRVAKGSKLTIAELDNNFSELVAASASLALKTDILNTTRTKLTSSFPNILIGADGLGGAGLFTSGALFVTGALSVSGSQTYSGSANFLGRVIASGSGNSVLGSNYVDDTAAAAGGVPVGGMYHNAGAIRIRLI